MKTILKISMLISVTLLFAACKKKSDTATATTTTTTNNPPPANVVCNGNGTTSFYPMKLANAWSYSYDLGNSPQLSDTGTRIFNSVVYNAIYDASHMMYIDPAYFREDATSHDIYRYDDSNTNSEYLEIPNAPVLNQTWTDANSYTRKVINLNASIATPTCSYSGLLEIYAHDAGNSVFTYLYYKKGLGLVYELDSTSFISGHFKLTAVTLK